MSFEVRPLDITQYKGDVIVNSLGIKKQIHAYGKVCRSIINATKSKEYKELIDSKENLANPGFAFVSKGYALPSKHIFNIVTPLFAFDNQLIALEYVYKLALITAYKNKWFKIALPLMGTGANGYPHFYALQMVIALLSAFAKMHKEMKITLCLPVVDLDDYNQNFNDKEIKKSVDKFFEQNEMLEQRRFEYDESSFWGLEDQNLESLLGSSFEEMRMEGIIHFERAPRLYSKETFMPLKAALLDGGVRPVKFDMQKLTEKSISYYIDTYIEHRYTNESDRKEVRKHVNCVISGDPNSTSMKYKHSKEEKRTTISVSVLMRYILALHMSKEEADDLLLFCGRVFSPVSKEDALYVELIKGKRYVDTEEDLDEINSCCLKHNVNIIFAYSF